MLEDQGKGQRMKHVNSISSVPRERAAAPPPISLAGNSPSWLRNRWTLVLGVFVLAGAGLALGWPWLVALGLAPVVLAVLPCAAMCGLGLCMMGGKNSKSCDTQADTPEPQARPSRLDT